MLEIKYSIDGNGHKHSNTIIQSTGSGCYDESIIFVMSSYRTVKPFRTALWGAHTGNVLQDFSPKHNMVTTRSLFHKRLEKLKNPKSMPTEWNNLIEYGDDDDGDEPFPAVGFDFETTQKRTYRLTLFRVEWKPIRSSICHTLDVYLFMIFSFCHPSNAKSSFCASFKGYKFTHVAHVTTFFLHTYTQFSRTCNTSICSPFQQQNSSLPVYVCVSLNKSCRGSINYHWKFTLQITNQITSYHTTEWRYEMQ